MTPEDIAKLLEAKGTETAEELNNRNMAIDAVRKKFMHFVKDLTLAQFDESHPNHIPDLSPAVMGMTLTSESMRLTAVAARAQAQARRGDHINERLFHTVIDLAAETFGFTAITESVPMPDSDEVMH